METTKQLLIPLACMLAATSLNARPNIVVIMTDQQRADLCAREGFPLDLTPFADSVARTGVWFNRAYTPCPASAPARVAMLTGRYPRVTRTDSNHNIADAWFGKDLFGTAHDAGYQTVLVGKNHTYLKPSDLDGWIGYNHLGQEGPDSVKTPEGREFDRYLKTLSFFTDLKPAPGTVESQLPYRIVTDALDWVDRHDDSPFIMWMSFPEPHNPYQVCEPYYSLFEGKVPPARTDKSALPVKGEKYEQLFEMMNAGHKGCSENLERIRANYMGMIRLLDDQMRRFVDGMKERGLYDNTIFVITADHGDYAGEYGLMKKGAGVPDAITRIPMVWFGAGVQGHGLREDCVSLVDLFPTCCEVMEAEIPQGVQGRSLAEMLSGRPYPKEEFQSILSEAGFGGQYITREDATDYRKEGALGDGLFFDELNSWSQSGMISMVRMGDWKLVMDMQGQARMYNLRKDPSEMHDLYGRRRYARKREKLLAEMLKWEIALNDPIPVPRSRYRFKRYRHNYLFSE